jgi:hypothetical protein
MHPIDLTVPLVPNLPVHPGQKSLEPIERIADGDSSNVSPRPPSARGGTTVIESRDWASPRVVLRKS